MGEGTHFSVACFKECVASSDCFIGGCAEFEDFIVSNLLVEVPRERIFIELMTSVRKLKASREGSK